jgi:hypothetical protein
MAMARLIVFHSAAVHRGPAYQIALPGGTRDTDPNFALAFRCVTAFWQKRVEQGGRYALYAKSG